MVSGYHTVPIQKNPVLRRKLALYLFGAAKYHVKSGQILMNLMAHQPRHICLRSVVPAKLIWVGEGLSYGPGY